MALISELLQRGRHLLLRVLPAQERRRAGHPGPDPARARAPGALVRLGHLPGRPGVAPAHPRPRGRHAAHHHAHADGPPHLRGPHPPGAGRDPGRRSARRASRTSWPWAATPRPTPRPGRASCCTPSSWSSWPGPSGASPSASPPTPPATRRRRTCLRPRPPGRQAAPGRLRGHPVLLRGRRVRRPGAGPGRPRRAHAGPARDHARDRPALGAPHGRDGRGPARLGRGPPRGGVGAWRATRPCARPGSPWPPSCARSCSTRARPGCTSTRSTGPARPGRSTPRSGLSANA